MTASIARLSTLKDVELMDDRYYAYGGFADIFRARWIQQAGEARWVAVKIVRRRHSGDSERNHKRFAREANLCAQLNHRNLVPLFGLYIQHDIPGLVMPFYKNGDLIGLVRHPEVDKLSSVRGIIAGLEYMHSFPQNPVVHGDMKAVYTGQLPFNHVYSDTSVILRICIGNLPNRPPEISFAMWTLLWRCWEVEPKRRPSAPLIGSALGAFVSQNVTPEFVLEIVESVTADLSVLGNQNEILSMMDASRRLESCDNIQILFRAFG
ncbi:hypothetical protein NP233_g5766 [Leucocoprinus birnbaumii]|uniref:Protein kinase domain-containing protein n=1 Tax=Leucocoprinus birnbaumii TaxID=56174 RepID=A0AAD5YWD7_9AGAR|nr:hypothetical protein NP233_g5766 [Leucocoprinus birnbaumii]